MLLPGCFLVLHVDLQGVKRKIYYLSMGKVKGLIVRGETRPLVPDGPVPHEFPQGKPWGKNILKADHPKKNRCDRPIPGFSNFLVDQLSSDRVAKQSPDLLFVTEMVQTQKVKSPSRNSGTVASAGWTCEAIERSPETPAVTLKRSPSFGSRIEPKKKQQIQTDRSGAEILLKRMNDRRVAPKNPS